MFSPITNQWELWVNVRCCIYLDKKKKSQRSQGPQKAQKEKRQSIMYWEIEVLGKVLALGVCYWVDSNIWTAGGNMEEIKIYQNIAKIGQEKHRNWKLTGLTRLPKSTSSIFQFFWKLSVLKTQDRGQLLEAREGKAELMGETKSTLYSCIILEVGVCCHKLVSM